MMLPVKLEQGEGWTRDVSAGGVFFTTQGALSTGERIRFTLVLEHVDPIGVAVRFNLYNLDSRKAPWGLA